MRSDVLTVAEMSMLVFWVVKITLRHNPSDRNVLHYHHYHSAALYQILSFSLYVVACVNFCYLDRFCVALCVNSTVVH
jgi:hypothetical protein